MHEFVDDTNPADNYTYPETEPAIGAVGDRVTVTSQFDGWGYIRLYDAATMQELHTSAIPEAMDPAFASGFGDLSVHEVATDPKCPEPRVPVVLLRREATTSGAWRRSTTRPPTTPHKATKRHPGQRSRLRAVDLRDP